MARAKTVERIPELAEDADAIDAIERGPTPAWHLEELARCDREDQSLPEPWETVRAEILATLDKRRRSA